MSGAGLVMVATAFTVAGAAIIVFVPFAAILLGVALPVALPGGLVLVALTWTFSAVIQRAWPGAAATGFFAGLWIAFLLLLLRDASWT